MEQIPQDILARAIEWHVQLSSGDVTEHDRDGFETWRREHPLHQLASHRVEKSWGRFDAVESQVDRAGLSAALVRPKTGRKRGAMLGIAIAICGWFAYHSQPVNIMMAQYKTPVGQQKTIELPDHSRITLNTNSAFDIDFSNDQRLIELYQGEIFIVVAHDSARPLVVSTPHGTARALGTQFNVRREDRMTSIGVLESAVEACNKPGLLGHRKASCVTIHSGQFTRLTEDGNVDAVRSIDPDALAGWTTGSLMFDNQRLPDVLQELQRYSHAEIRYDPASIGQLRVSGVLPLDNVVNTIQLLAQRMPIQVTVVSEEVIQVGRR